MDVKTYLSSLSPVEAKQAAAELAGLKGQRAKQNRELKFRAWKCENAPAFTPAPPMPSDWQNGFPAPYRLQTGEIPFLHYGKWYLYVWDADKGDNALYGFSEDRFWPYTEGRREIGID